MQEKCRNEQEKEEMGVEREEKNITLQNNLSNICFIKNISQNIFSKIYISIQFKDLSTTKCQKGF